LQVLLDWLETSLKQRPTLWMCALLAAGFVVRIWHASGTFLNPDEVMHFLAANKTSWWLTYQASLTVSHPPLLILLLHAWRSLGTSELTLRMPSILAGTAFCWLSYKWLAALFRESVVWIAFLLVLFLPSSIELSTEIRQYALLMAFAMGSAYLLERGLTRNSAPAMLFSGVCLWLAICSHYSAFLFAAALGFYAILRMVKDHPHPKVLALWGVGQVIGLGLCCFFYVTHISRLDAGTSAAHAWMSDVYLAKSYFAPGKINPLLFIFARTGGVFQFAFAQSAIGDMAYVLFVVGIILLLRKPGVSHLKPGHAAVLLVLPFVLNCGAALIRAYPYGGTRHSSFLLPLALTGVSLSLAYLLKDRPALGVVSALLIVLACNVFQTPRQPYMSRQDQKRDNMDAALAFIRHQIAPDEIIFADNQTSRLVEYYLCDQHPVTRDHSVPGFVSYDCGGHHVIVTDWKTSIFTARSFYDHWQVLVQEYSLRSGTRVWVTQMGWSTYLATELQAFPEFHLSPHFFGKRIQIFDLTVGQSMPDPELLPTS